MFLKNDFILNLQQILFQSLYLTMIDCIILDTVKFICF